MRTIRVATWAGLLLTVGACGDDSATGGQGGTSASTGSEIPSTTSSTSSSPSTTSTTSTSTSASSTGTGPDLTPPTTTFASVPPADLANGVPSVFALSCSEVACTYECALDGGPFAACTATPSFDPLAPGEHRLAVRATDAAGNVETTPMEHVWTLAFGYRQVASSVESACAISGEGGLYCWGTDYQGILGNGSGDVPSARPVAIDVASTWVRLFPGSNTMCAAKSTGELFCWGSSYPLGDETDTAIESPAPFAPAGGAYVSIDMGYGYACGLDAAGHASCVGEGYEGSLGDGDPDYHYSATPISLGNGLFQELSVGDGHACGLTDAGAIVCWGSVPVVGPTVAPTQVGSDTDWAHVSAGTGHTCAIKTGGTLHCWGRNYSGQLGVGDTMDRPAPAQIGSASDWVAVEAGEGTTCARNAASDLYCWGENYDGQVGSAMLPNGSVLTPALVSPGRFGQVSSGAETTCAAGQDGRVHCWGNNYQGRLGRGVTEYQGSLVTIDNQFDTISLAGDQGGCGLVGDQALCWGYGPVGQADGLPRVTPTPIAPANQWTSIAASQYGDHACGVRGGVVYCWGTNNNGQLGNGSTVASLVPNAIAPISGSPVFTSVSVGRESACAVTTERDLYCWGANIYGELGIGTTTPEYAPVKVAGTGWDTISLGAFRSAARKTDGTIWHWGVNDGTTPSQLPGTDWASVGATGFGECGIKTDGTLHCTQQGIAGIFQAGSASNWSKVIGPGFPYCALDATGAVGCFVAATQTSFMSSPTVVATDGWSDFEYPTNTYCGLRGTERQCRGFRRFGSLGDGFDERVPAPILAPQQ